MRKFIARRFWKLGTRIARIGCWIRGAHIEGYDTSADYCLQCQRHRGATQLPWISHRDAEQ